MGRIFAILLLVVSLWVGLEVFRQGVDGAFGGALSFLGGGERERLELPSMRTRVHDAVSDAHAEAAARRERLLAE